MLSISLLALGAAVSLYDLRSGKVPNFVTLPLLAAGWIAHFPGTPAVWLLTTVLAAAWKGRWLSGGDVKLWAALLWALPGDVSSAALPAFFATFFVTGLLQLALRARTGLRTPGAWRCLPFLLWSLHVH